ncbi:homoserine O-acetyltransferase [Ruficoccus sp. ZRK36]|uniref:homoserine O-acetyltransferase MetX n=1 Tax=Ruficoccus sp. ZRK36 TaxID=2866311 RepID=UPI001C736741|nr:homoserine O-acetyltransferase [Ruficoccus sp. ZRK36]QYY36944.1 homoserine O-acetyltransferase [Ruficoccus sp. ZRK36]
MNDAEAAPVLDEGEVGLVEYHDFVCKEPFTFEEGGQLPGFTLRYETYGKLNAARDNAIFIFHALSGDHHCAGVYSLQDAKPGWWNNMIGPGKPIDTLKYFVVGSNCLGGCQGSTGPSSINPATGKRYGLSFPQVSIRDMVRAQRRLLDHLGIEKLHCVIGGSMGGMQALQWAIEYPDRVNSLLAMATTSRQSAQAIAFNEVGRSAIVQDPGWHEGDYEPGKGPNVGLAVARMMAHITYLSDEGLSRKFGRVRKREAESGSQGGFFDVEFEVESYLRYQGKSFVNRFDANTYLYFTKALDRFDLGKGGPLEKAFENLQARALVVGFTSDWLFPPGQNRDIAHAMLRSGKNASYAELNMDLGHDSFLIRAPELYELVSGFLTAEEAQQRHH